ncbi:hypothetical protein [Emcibacter nanhaiensis]|uniref:Uncharacterized protein n=1 Tax=Emcibacter nanhaiensis TaxID=1505037 RepID=A0A501PV35_9PROT|nr:hypothetical protein [Emcibacter nanhaiensis]TPD64008.1 hypothetical protein FIV46_00080 [Emcibacter nanhaiensis]
MIFRADEEQSRGYARAERYLIPMDFTEEQRERSLAELQRIVERCGPVVESYPSWHPLVAQNQDQRSPIVFPEERGGYAGLDHTILFVNGFVTCPYDDGQRVVDSVEAFNTGFDEIATIKTEILKVPFYADRTTPILVYCDWHRPLLQDRTIPKSLAIPLMLEQEVPCWRTAELAETWETMRPYFLGAPHGSRSSLFLNQETGQALKNVWNALIKTEMFGPVKD